MKILTINQNKNLKRTSIILFITMLLLVLIGCVFVYSASFYSAEISYHNKFFFAKKQLIGGVIGLVFCIIFSKIDYHKLDKIKLPLVIVSYVLLGLVFVPGIGLTNYGATRWINLRFITFQPSEIAKFAFIVFSAGILSKKSENIKSFKGVFTTLLVGAIFCLLIIIEPNMSITICMGLLIVVMLFIGGISFKQFIILLIPTVVVGVILVFIEPYRVKRLVAFVDPFASSKGEGFQLVQSLLGIALGGPFGVGLFKSRQKYLFLPFSESDFIFSIIAEETGFFGCLILLILFLIMFMCIIKISRNAPDRFGSLLGTGIGSLILIQVLLNLSVCSGLIPPTGLPLPFISAGSTSLLVFMSAIGVVLNVDRQSRKSKI